MLLILIILKTSLNPIELLPHHLLNPIVRQGDGFQYFAAVFATSLSCLRQYQGVGENTALWSHCLGLNPRTATK